MSEATGETLVLTEHHAGYRVLVLNRPDRLNAFNEPLHLALRSALSAAAADPECRALILTGAGRGFCAGQDLAARNFAPDVEPDLSRTLEEFYNPLVKQIRDLPMPLICAVNGVAAGAGASLAFHGDLVLAARSAKFLQAFAKLGLIPDAGGTWLLPRLAGRARARGMALLAEPITAEQAESWGMIWRVIDDAELMAEAHKLAAQLAQAPTYGLALIRRALDASETNDLEAQLAVERDLQGEAGRSPDYREGVAAFLDKRPARFTGRSR